MLAGNQSSLVLPQINGSLLNSASDYITAASIDSNNAPHGNEYNRGHNNFIQPSGKEYRQWLKTYKPKKMAH
jgi:hypothetical protein